MSMNYCFCHKSLLQSNTFDGKKETKTHYLDYYFYYNSRNVPFLF